MEASHVRTLGGTLIGWMAGEGMDWMSRFQELMRNQAK